MKTPALIITALTIMTFFSCNKDEVTCLSPKETILGKWEEQIDYSKPSLGGSQTTYLFEKDSVYVETYWWGDVAEPCGLSGTLYSKGIYYIEEDEITIIAKYTDEDYDDNVSICNGHEEDLTSYTTSFEYIFVGRDSMVVNQKYPRQRYFSKLE